jgi:signal transduction histidine kinase/CheY-like chemotaxis protein/HPt (histidine-containing phosphotransfer) domain-containing protein
MKIRYIYLLIILVVGKTLIAQEKEYIPNRKDSLSHRIAEYRKNMNQLNSAKMNENDSLEVESYKKLSRFYFLCLNIEKAKYYKNMELNLITDKFPGDTAKFYAAKLELMSLVMKSNSVDRGQLFEILNFAKRTKNDELRSNSIGAYLSYLLQNNLFKEYSDFFTIYYPEELEGNASRHVFCRKMAIIKEVSKELDSSIYYMNEAASKINDSEMQNPYYRSNFFFRYGQMLERQKNDEAAIIQYLKALKLAEELGYTPFMLQASERLLELHKNRGEFEKALKFAYSNLILQDELSELSNSGNLFIIETEKETELAKIEMEKLALENNAKMGVERNRKNIFMITGIALLIIIIGLWHRFRFIYRANLKLESEKEKTERAILKAEAMKSQAETEKKRAEESEAFERQFIANMSHEIRTPMNAVMGMTNLVLDTALEPKQREYLEGIKLSSDNLLHIINDVLDLSKIEAGKMEVEELDFSLYETINQVKNTLLHRASEKGLELKSFVQPDVIDIVVGDPFRLCQILINLVGNAIKFTDKGSVSIEVENCKGKVKISVIDTGMGISKDKLKKIFKNFTQAHVSDNRRFGGTGLGLSISKQLVELMEGTINVESDEGVGTVFSINLKLPNGKVERLAERMALKNDIDGSILDGLNILVVDDNEFNIIVARDVLKSKAKLKIGEARNGQEAVDQLKKTKYDVVLMDVQMPVLNGFLATEKIRRELAEPGCNTPIIALTASVLRGDIERCMEAGMNSYIAKPFKTQDLIAEIAKVLNIKLRVLESNKDKIKNKPVIIKSKKFTDLTYLSRFCKGDQEKMNRYVSLFLKSAPQLAETILKAIEEKDLETIANQVHGFKTRWVMMGMEETKELAMKLEDQCRKDEDLKKIQNNVKVLLKYVNIAILELAVS